MTRLHPSSRFRFRLSRRPGIIPAGEELPATAVPLRPLRLSCAPTASAFLALQDELRTLVRRAGGTFAGDASVSVHEGRLHLRATVMFWPGAIPAGDLPRERDTGRPQRLTMLPGPGARASSVPPP